MTLNTYPGVENATTGSVKKQVTTRRAPRTPRREGRASITISGAERSRSFLASTIYITKDAI